MCCIPLVHPWMEGIFMDGRNSRGCLHTSRRWIFPPMAPAIYRYHRHPLMGMPFIDSRHYFSTTTTKPEALQIMVILIGSYGYTSLSIARFGSEVLTTGCIVVVVVVAVGGD